MRARILLNLALLALVAALALLALRAPERERASAAPPLTALDPAAVRRVVIAPDAREPFELARDASGWWLVRPLAVPADDFRVQALLGVLRAPSHRSFGVAPGELARYGLRPPLVSVRVDGLELAIGATEALDRRRYVRVGSDVHLIDDAQYHHLSARAENFVHPSPLGPRADPVHFELPGLELSRDGHGRWRARPSGAMAGADRRNAFASAWAGARATHVRPFDPALDWQLEIAVRPAPGAALVRFAVARGEYETVLGREALGVQWHLTRQAGDRLLPSSESPAALRAREGIVRRNETVPGRVRQGVGVHKIARVAPPRKRFWGSPQRRRARSGAVAVGVTIPSRALRPRPRPPLRRA